MIEAMSCGLCCIGSSVGGIIELAGKPENDLESTNFRICENGILFPPKNSDALEQALIRVIKDHELRKKLSENARKKVLENNSINSVAGHYIDLFTNKQL
jgi:glycosyltransferase involved in cell wall biosynthesis